MSETIETMGQLMGASPQGLEEGQVSALRSSKKFTVLQAALALVPMKALADLPHGIGDVLKPVMDLRVGEVVAGTWNVGRDLWKFRDSAKYPTTDVFEHPLNEHKVSTAFHPKVMVSVNGQPVPGAELEFTVTLALTIESAVLRIRDKHIIGATIAKCKGKGTLSCGEAVLLECPTRDFLLPTLRLEPGVLIG
jgi:hypothetical protein